MVTDGGTPEAPFAEGRWVLRDRDGLRVPALVQPRCGHIAGAAAYQRCLPMDFGAKVQIPCARIIAHEGRYLNLEYDLETGLLGPCMKGPSNSFVEDGADWSEVIGAIYLNDQCEGQSFALAEGGIGYANLGFTKARDIFFTLGDIWYPSEFDCVHAQAWRSAPGGLCDGPFAMGRLCPLERVPVWVQGLLPKPPYTMDVEYE